MEKLYCVFDYHYGDYVESFETERQATEYCHDLINSHLDKDFDFDIGKWIGDSEQYERIKHIYYKADRR